MQRVQSKNENIAGLKIAGRPASTEALHDFERAVREKSWKGARRAKHAIAVHVHPPVSLAQARKSGQAVRTLVDSEHTLLQRRVAKRHPQGMDVSRAAPHIDG